MKKRISLLVAGVMYILASGVVCEASPPLGDSGIFGGYTTVKPNVMIILDTSGSMGPPSTNGSYINYTNMSGQSVTGTKLSLTIDAIKYIIDNRLTSSGTELVRLGLMVLDKSNNYCGGYIVAPCGTSYSNIKTYLDTKVTPGGNTPIAESLAEAGLYFAGRNSWAWQTRGVPTGGDTATSNNNMGSAAFSANWDSVSTWVTYDGSGTKTYKSPIQYRCQKNYAIVFTDGQPTSDNGNYSPDTSTNDVCHDEPYTYCCQWFLFLCLKTCQGTHSVCTHTLNYPPIFPGTDDYTSTTYINTTINTGSGSYLDDVAYALNHQDFITSGTDKAGISFESAGSSLQNVRTYTIGFGADTDVNLLRNTARNGGGSYYSASNEVTLVNSFSLIFADIFTTCATFISPVVPLSKSDGTYAGNAIYFGFFKTMSGENWRGNVKKYGFDDDGNVYNKDGVLGDASTYATDDEGALTSTAFSAWTTGDTPDGNQNDAGGVGAWMLSDASGGRTRLFYTDSSTSDHVDDNLVTFNTSNTGLSADYVAWLTADSLTSGATTYNYTPGTTNGRSWVMGDILHSRPTIFGYGNNNVILVGANDGFLHCIVDTQNGANTVLGDLADDTVAVRWSYAPRELLSTMPSLKDDPSGHYYFVDGVPVTHNYSGRKYVTFGLRRGGNNWYTLQVGTVDGNGDFTGYSSPPTSRWWINGASTTISSESLGQSWSKPILCNIMNGTTLTPAMILTGGYDATVEDALDPATPPASPITNSTTKGRAVYAVNPGSGVLLKSFLITTNGVKPSHSVVDMLAYAHKNNISYVDTIYAPDMGGNVYAARDASGNGTWTAFKLFEARSGDGANMVLKMFYAPDVTLQSGNVDYVFIGTGDREHPNSAAVTNGRTQTIDRIYSIPNNWSGSLKYETSLNNITTYSYSATLLSTLRGTSSNGWFIEFNETGTHGYGEKVISSPVVFNGVVYFTTYTPPVIVANANTDECGVVNLGISRLYALNYKTGEAAFNFDLTNDADANHPTYARSDRYKDIGTGMATQPTVVVTSKGPELIVGANQAIQKFDLGRGENVHRYFWRQN